MSSLTRLGLIFNRAETLLMITPLNLYFPKENLGKILSINKIYLKYNLCKQQK